MRSRGTISRYSPWKATSKPSEATITYRHAPPSRRSMSQDCIVPRRPGHQRETSSGSVNARQTRCTGASNARVIRIWVSVGVETTALLIIGELLEHVVECLEPLAPRAL